MTLATFGLFFAPRIALGLIWAFTDRVDNAFENLVWPALGLALAPTATILYVLLWAPEAGARGVSGTEWVIVGIGAAVDAAIWVTRLAPPRPP
jgi:hypothetical protein